MLYHVCVFVWMTCVPLQIVMGLVFSPSDGIDADALVRIGGIVDKMVAITLQQN